LLAKANKGQKINTLIGLLPFCERDLNYVMLNDFKICSILITLNNSKITNLQSDATLNYQKAIQYNQKQFHASKKKFHKLISDKTQSGRIY